MIKILQRPDKIYLHNGDIPEWAIPKNLEKREVAIDTEAMGLCFARDRLCLVQLSFDGKECHLIKYDANKGYNSPNLMSILEDETMIKLFHYARFDIGLLFYTFGVLTKNIYCTKIASKLARTFTERHGLKTVCNALLGVDISKKEQASDWGNDSLSSEQQCYAAMDVLYLHLLKEKFDVILEREDRKKLAYDCFECVPCIAQLDCLQWSESLFGHL